MFYMGTRAVIPRPIQHLTTSWAVWVSRPHPSFSYRTSNAKNASNPSQTPLSLTIVVLNLTNSNGGTGV